eukprot:3097299-Amphidinium_carterae.1
MASTMMRDFNVINCIGLDFVCALCLSPATEALKCRARRHEGNFVSVVHMLSYRSFDIEL